MKILDFVDMLSVWDRKGRRVFTKADLRQIYRTESEKTFDEGLRRMVGHGLVTRVASSVFVNPRNQGSRKFLLDEIASALRRGEYNYISLESALSEWGVISQIPIDRMTLMTTGRSGEFDTPYGVLEFTHTSRSIPDILTNTVASDRPLRFAAPNTALRDLKRVGRNMHLVSMADYEEVMEEFNV
jgi:predicted transcriptional regulator of viral defense system